mmetsp:Transcript_39668/g.61912  ORF Transcript_39668/g.61912 Transcript_39668/m.61912 type:complete len:119 (-) Transcript_39668:33-389(-)|eukprot:CAMPEP_0184288822 /NCGR_PEP_ID=MMETSP1049-20130417/1297_1 /TAXON_ID=77928 /ORGANISM="Proteomonas sulcata, Strain CCMP704" /LENGTH=118 /DNA_ID=CAMNT_0026595369 /DNA_START=152 /DNA_END=508 /DNA_ORIENTATION=+
MAGYRIAAVVSALTACLVLALAVASFQPSKTSLLTIVQLDEGDQLLGKMCCATVPLPCCTSEACCDAWVAEGLDESERALPVSLTSQGSPLYLSQIPINMRQMVVGNAKKVMSQLRFF